mmetsp:Transcript_18029/g.36120  ORF Transcript_18029/g.36120 Transcript_18029/m.36120 type:complete len:219 (+) Transcript_18029:93-749(+)
MICRLACSFPVYLFSASTISSSSLSLTWASMATLLCRDWSSSRTTFWNLPSALIRDFSLTSMMRASSMYLSSLAVLSSSNLLAASCSWSSRSFSMRPSRSRRSRFSTSNSAWKAASMAASSRPRRSMSAGMRTFSSSKRSLRSVMRSLSTSSLSCIFTALSSIAASNSALTLAICCSHHACTLLFISTRRFTSAPRVFSISPMVTRSSATLCSSFSRR